VRGAAADRARARGGEQGRHRLHPGAPVEGEVGAELLSVVPHGLLQRLHAHQLPRGQG